MRAKGSFMSCPFCGGTVKMEQGYGGIHFFICADITCGAVMSFASVDKIEVDNPVANYSRRVPAKSESMTLFELLREISDLEQQREQLKADNVRLRDIISRVVDEREECE